jgi:nucleoside-specific outer membrane channel protein Tsx
MKLINRLIVTLFLCITSLPLAAFDWTSSNIQYLHGSGYLLGAKDRDIVTIEHSDGWQYGQNFLFIDTIHHDDKSDAVSWEAYGEAYSYFSGSKITGLAFNFGPIKDLGLTLGINAGSQPSQTPFRAYLAGVSLQFDLPLFKFLQVDFLAYKNANLSSTSFQITPSWELPFQLAGLPMSFRGFMDYVATGGSGDASTVLFQPQLLLDVGNFIDHKNQLMLGVEYQYWHNKFGLQNLDESLPQAVAMLRF